MIVQFPSFYPDELVYSLLARYYVKSGYMRYTFAAQDLFASKTVRPNIEFVNQYTPAACEILTKNLPIEYIIEKHTMFPFYGRFIKQDRKQKAFESLCGMKGNYYNLLPMQKSKDGKERHLRYCPICVSEDRERFGESYWHRLHQLQGMNCCSIHKCRLIDSSIVISGKGSPKLVTAEEMIPSESKINVVDNVMEIKLADYMARIFQADMDMKSEVTIGAYLHSKMPVNKYRSIRGEQRNMALFHSDFMEYYKELEQNHFTEIWQIQKVFTDQRANFNEVCMIALFLEIAADELVKPALPETSDEEAFDERVKELHNQGLKYPEIAKLLGASYNVVKPVGEERYGNKIGRKHNKGGCQKKDWNSIDIQTLPMVTAAIKDLQGSRITRPKKITVYAVARQMNVHSKYFDNLPLCKQEILEHYESQEEYWAREVVWAVQKILSEGQPLNWKHIRNLTNMRNENFQECKPYLEMYLDDEMGGRIREVL
jgi:hypothetical protein